MNSTQILIHAHGGQLPHSDPEVRKAYLKEYARKNREKLKEYQSAYRKDHAEESRSYQREYQRDYYHAVVKHDEAKVMQARAKASRWYVANSERAKIAAKASCLRRRKLLPQVTPSWANMDRIKAIYADAMQRTISTGIRHEVDHIVPLRGKLVQGLHCEANLRIVTMKENRAKGSSYLISGD